jgi:hypothetical protein
MLPGSWKAPKIAGATVIHTTGYRNKIDFVENAKS